MSGATMRQANLPGRTKPQTNEASCAESEHDRCESGPFETVASFLSYLGH